MPNVFEMVKEELKQMGADGLCNTDTECGCEIADLAPCGQICGECDAAWNHPGRAKENGVDFWMVPFSSSNDTGEPEGASK